MENYQGFRKFPVSNVAHQSICLTLSVTIITGCCFFLEMNVFETNNLISCIFSNPLPLILFLHCVAEMQKEGALYAPNGNVTF